MSWAHPFVLAAVPLLLVAVWWMFRRSRPTDGPAFANIARRWADRDGLSAKPAATRRSALRGVALLVAGGAALLALARPQWGEIAEPSYEQSREVMLALDLSRSMLADDVSPSRLARAKLLVESLLDQLKGERVGLIVFSGTAFVQSPLSADYEVLRDFLGELDPSYLPAGGTDYASMLRTAAQSFGQQGAGDRYLVVLSDGEALDEGWQAYVPALRERGVHVIGLGVGTPQGALVPDGRGGLVKDEHGAAVVSRLEPRTLQELAEQTDGTYRDAATWVDIASLVDATVEQGRKGAYVEQRNVRLQDRYQWFLAPAVLCLLLSFWIEFPVAPLARALHTRGRRPHPASAPAIAAVLMALAAWHTPRPAFAAVPDTPPSPSGTASQPNPLTATVAELSNKPSLAALDYARLATDTIRYASQPSAPTDGARTGIIDDGLAAVDRGAVADPHAADWPALRQQLEQLKQAKKQPPQSQQQEKNQSKQDQQGQGQQGQGQHGQDQRGQAGQGQSQGQQDQSQNGAGEQPTGDRGDASKQPNQPAPGSKGEERKDEADDRSAGANPRQADSDAQRDSAGSTHDDADRKNDAQDAHDQRQAAGGEVKRDDQTQPNQAPEAGLGDQDEHEHEAPPAAADPHSPAAQPPATRMVGGGRALRGVEPQGDTALAEAISKMEHVKEGDAPAVLFDRMNRAEGQPRAEKHGKNW
jgi:Ca-activated chloride channel family protein